MSLTPRPNVLEYSTRDPEIRWGPIFFKPSWRTVLLFLLTATATTWLALRHEPWRRISTFPIGRGNITLSAGGNLLNYTTEKANLYHAATGQLIKSVSPYPTSGKHRVA